MELRARAVLLDIEGTLGSMSFVRDVLFPYARDRMDAFVRTHEDDPAVRAILDETAREAGCDVHDLGSILKALHAWEDADMKVTALKQLQGKIWVEGYERAGIRGHLYPDSIDALHRFRGAGVSMYVYSSGSIAAQRLLFGNSVAGDLIPLFSGFYDTTIGGKRLTSSYVRICKEIAIEPGDVVFFSDNLEELDAARASGIQTVQVARPEDGTRPTKHHPVTESFAGISIVVPSDALS